MIERNFLFQNSGYRHNAVHNSSKVKLKILYFGKKRKP